MFTTVLGKVAWVQPTSSGTGLLTIAKHRLLIRKFILFSSRNFTYHVVLENGWCVPYYESKKFFPLHHLQELQKDYFKMQARADDLRREIKSLHKHIEDMGRQHKEALNTQVKHR